MMHRPTRRERLIIANFDTFRDALADAADYHRHLSATCENCTGATCDECAAHCWAADGYEYLGDALDEPGPPREQDVTVRDELL
ncbi:MAG: hypothetical protein FWE35_10920 [Streptosporangiales bacterium]|nr:hypothetical protein [Streptosporangiales bacterium]